MEKKAVHLRYRPDIDGLRALAVIPVVLFHLGLGMTGGFVGVDVFFVISGFLITSIILKETHAGTFSMAGFWERRIRRIIPALTVVAFVTVIGALIVIYPRELRHIGKEIVAQATMVANFYHYEQDGYFGGRSEHFPFLHTWSLAVEEQFYFLFPLFVGWLLKRRKNIMLWVGCLTALSMALSFYWVGANQSAAFYLLPARAWELLLGALMAIYFSKSPGHKLPVAMAEGMSLAGVGMILYAVFAFDETTLFPGAYALIPCLGAAGLIFANHGQQTLAGRLLSTPPFVGVGKISYSLYLWHWPLIVFARDSSVFELTMQAKVGLVALSFLLAYATWRWVETPCRNPQFIPSRRRVFKIFFSLVVFFVLVGTVIYKTRGVPFRFSDEVHAYIDNGKLKNIQNTKEVIAKEELPLINPGDKSAEVLPVLIWGDSHLMSLRSVFSLLCKENGINVYYAARYGTPPLLGVKCPPITKIPEFNNAVDHFITKQKIKDVVFVARWCSYPIHVPELMSSVNDPSLSPHEAFRQSFEKTVASLNQRGVRVWIFKEVPYQKISPPYVLANAIRYGRKGKYDMENFGITVEDHLNHQKFVNGIIQKLEGDRVKVLDSLPYFENEQGMCRIGSSGYSLYRDTNHLSDHGAFMLKPLFKPMVECWVDELSSKKEKKNP
jgi:peptidoglycan/LPS O-acetylase OafA/YrhL